MNETRERQSGADREFIFLAGLHRSGTSLLNKIIQEHPEISGFSNTGVAGNEGQHLQTVFESAKTFGGPGKFAYDSRSHMDESHPVATPENAETILREWSRHYDLSRRYLVEKSPPNLVRTRFLQKLFPNSRFIVILRHPIAVSYATKKWSRTTTRSLLEHALLAYEIFLKDMGALKSVYVLRYEEFVLEPQRTLDEIFDFLGLESVTLDREVRPDINRKYFSMWESDRNKIIHRIVNRFPESIESRANQCGYSIYDHEHLVPVSWLGAHTNSV